MRERTNSDMRGPLASLLSVAAVAVVLLAPALTSAASLRGSSSSLTRQNRQAQAHDFTFIVTRSQLERFVQRGYLVRVRDNADFRLHGVSFPYARAEVKLFIERLADQYRSACGEQLVVTSLTRPKNYQPRNASSRSVHPTGMALDLRRPNNWTCRSWLERVLVTLEARGVLEANYERRPPHYHVAVFPRPYREYVERIVENPDSVTTYLVSRGDTLSAIARRHRTSVDLVKAHNGLRSDRIYAGQLLEVPVDD